MKNQLLIRGLAALPSVKTLMVCRLCIHYCLHQVFTSIVYINNSARTAYSDTALENSCKKIMAEMQL